MAIYEVSTWAELVEATNTTYNNGDIIKITKDIDCNKSIPEGVASTLQFNLSSGSSLITIDGEYLEGGVSKNHVIKNLRTHVTSPVPVFSNSSGSNIKLKGLDFVNLIMDSTLVKTYTNSASIYITNCRFVGERTYCLIGDYLKDYKIYLTSCFFNVPFVGTNKNYIPVCRGSSSNCEAYYCWFRETYGGWDVSQGIDTSTKYIKMTGCYVDGVIVGDNTIVITDQYSYNSVIQNVIDVDLRTKSAVGTTISVSAPKGIWKDLIRGYESESVTGYSYTNVNAANAIPETPSNMLNPTQLYNDGFDIVH